MNRLESKKHRFFFGVSLVVLLIGVTAAALLSNLGFSHTWVKWGLLLGLVGAAGLGVGVALYVHSIPHQDKYRKKRLEVKAWKDLGIYLYSLIVGGVSFYYLIAHSDKMRILNTSPAKIIMLSATIVVGIWVAVGPFIMKKRLLKGLDERERLIYEKAKMISDSFFGGLSMAGFIGIFIWFGPKAPIPVFVPVLMFFALAFMAEAVKPLVILIQCKMEQPEGGPA